MMRFKERLFKCHRGEVRVSKKREMSLFGFSLMDKVKKGISFLGPVWFSFLKLSLRTNFENTDNTILMFSKKCFCYVNLCCVFFMFSKKKNLNMFSFFFSFFRIKNSF